MIAAILFLLVVLIPLTGKIGGGIGALNERAQCGLENVQSICSILTREGNDNGRICPSSSGNSLLKNINDSTNCPLPRKAGESSTKYPDIKAVPTNSIVDLDSLNEESFRTLRDQRRTDYKKNTDETKTKSNFFGTCCVTG